MALYKADVWLGSNSGRQTVSVSASTPTGAKEQIRTIYHVRDTAIWNVREAPRERAGGGDSGDGSDASLWGGAALVALLAMVWVVASFTPQVFGLVGGSATLWLLCRLQGKRFDDLLLPGSRRALLITMALTSAACVASAVVGRHVQLDHFTEGRPEAQEVRPADPAGASGPTQARPQQGTQPARVPPAAGDL
jgi:hypothetical protein